MTRMVDRGDTGTETETVRNFLSILFCPVICELFTIDLTLLAYVEVYRSKTAC